MREPVTAEQVATWRAEDVQKVQDVLKARHKCQCYQCVAKHVNKNGFPEEVKRA